MTSSLHHEGGVHYQGECFLHIGISVLLLFFNYRVVTNLFPYEDRVHCQGEYFLHFFYWYKCIIVVLHVHIDVCVVFFYFQL